MSEIVYICEKCMGAPATCSHVEKGTNVMYMDRCMKCMGDERVSALRLEGYDFDNIFHPKCPKTFMRTDLSRLSAKTRAATDWRPGGEKSGLLLHGTTGTGKSRMAWWLVNSMWSDRLRSKNPTDPQMNVQAFTMRALGDAITHSYSDSGQGHDRLMKGLVGCDLLMLDDLGKERMTPRVASDLFSLIDERASAERPCIITTNFNGQGLAGRFEDAEMGAAVVRRLRDYYRVVSCT